MKNIYLIFVILIIFIQFSCIGKFEDINTDKTGYSEELQQLDYNWYGIPLINVQQGIYFNYDWGDGKNWTFQIMQNLSVDMFCGYFHDYKPFVGGLSNTVYNLNNSWNGSMWEYTYWYIVPQIKKAEERNEGVNPEFYAITKILKVSLLHRISDIYGPIIYNDFGNTILGGIPDSQEEAYYSFFKDLEEAIELLKENIDSEKFNRFDILMPEGKKNCAQWIKFANSLRLRLAIRIAQAEPEKGKEEALKSLDIANGGLLEETDDIVAVSTLNTGYRNPLGEVNKSWGEVLMNANMESILKGYNDPRLSHYFEETTEEGLPRYKGIRQGTGFNHERYANHSKSTISQNFNATLMSSEEVWFLRAEAALRGWSSESVKDCYERGIKESFARWMIYSDYVNSYLENDNTGADYVDAFNEEYNINARCLVSPKWEESATNEEKLEKIITQKWIACYPEGCEAWAEQRRTGYPRLFPVYLNMSNGTIDTEIMIRRLNFPVSISSSSPGEYSTLLEKLGGADNGGTRLWWDTGINF